MTAGRITWRSIEGNVTLTLCHSHLARTRLRIIQQMGERALWAEGCGMSYDIKTGELCEQCGVSLERPVHGAWPPYRSVPDPTEVSPEG